METVIKVAIKIEKAYRFNNALSNEEQLESLVRAAKNDPFEFMTGEGVEMDVTGEIVSD